MIKKTLKWLLALTVVAIVGLYINWTLSVPSHDRSWRQDQSRLPTVAQTDGTWTISNVRNWTYAQDGSAEDALWVDATIDPKTLTRTWFLMEPFGEIEAIAHTMLGFEFADGTVLIASVEARRERAKSTTHHAPLYCRFSRPSSSGRPSGT